MLSEVIDYFKEKDPGNLKIAVLTEANTAFGDSAAERSPQLTATWKR